MEQKTKSAYSTATSLTARQINRRIILGIIWHQQPISRADTARETGLQRSTVSLIVDELIRDGWIVEGEHGRIPRGRRPVYLQLNAAQAGLYSVFVRGNQVELSASNLNGACLWVGRERIEECSMGNVARALQHLHSQVSASIRHQMKGVGVAVEGIAATAPHIRTTVSELFNLPTAVGSVALACAKWFQLNHKDARLANDHLLSIHVDDQDITMGAIIAGRPLYGAHGQAVNLLPLTEPNDACATSCDSGSSAATAVKNTLLLDDACITRVCEATKLGVAAYDPGVVLISGNFGDEFIETEQKLTQDLKTMSSSGTEVRVVDTSCQETDIYRRGAMGLIMAHFLEDGSN